MAKRHDVSLKQGPNSLVIRIVWWTKPLLQLHWTCCLVGRWRAKRACFTSLPSHNLLEPGGGVFVTEHLHVAGGELLLSNTTADEGGQAVWRIRVSSVLEALQGAFGGH